MLIDTQSLGFEPIGRLDQLLGWLAAVAIVSPVWLIFVFAAFAIGRRRLGLRELFIFVALEAVALGLAIYVDSKTWPSERPPRPRININSTTNKVW